MVHFDADALRRDWSGGEDPERAVAQSSVFFRLVLEGSKDPQDNPEYLGEAIDAHLDGPGDKRLVVPAVEVAVRSLRAGENDMKPSERIGPRIEALVMKARTAHRTGNHLEAGRLAYQGVFHLELAAGSREALLQAMASVEHSLIAEKATDAIAIAAAAYRRGNFESAAFERLYGELRALFSAYVLSGHAPVIYKRTPAMAAQMFYLMASLGRPEDAALVEIAYALDVQTRGTDARSQATTPLRDLTFARFKGDLAVARAKVERAIASLKGFPLPRHLAMAQTYNYFGL